MFDFEGALAASGDVASAHEEVCKEELGAHAVGVVALVFGGHGAVKCFTVEVAADESGACFEGGEVVADASRGGSFGGGCFVLCAHCAPWSCRLCGGLCDVVEIVFPVSVYRRFLASLVAWGSVMSGLIVFSWAVWRMCSVHGAQRKPRRHVNGFGHVTTGLCVSLGAATARGCPKG